MRLRVLPLVLLASAATLFLAGPGAVAAAPTANPTLTVVGFGLANLTPSKATAPPELELNFLVAGATASQAVAELAADVALAEKALEKAGVPKAAFAPQGPPGLNFIAPVNQQSCEKLAKLKGVPPNCPSPGYQANEQIQVTFPNLTALATAITKADLAKAKGLANTWINSGGPLPATPTPSALAQAYRQAFQDADRTAQIIAAAQHRALGPILSVTEGAILNFPCGGMGCGPIPVQGINPPTPGPNQELVAVTVTYATSP